jgi:hypothetical protein
MVLLRTGVKGWTQKSKETQINEKKLFHTPRIQCLLRRETHEQINIRKFAHFYLVYIELYSGSLGICQVKDSYLIFPVVTMRAKEKIWFEYNV